jgi:AraC-like DNA-binding protein
MVDAVDSSEKGWDGLEPGRAEVIRAHVPAPPLSRFVEVLWYYEGTTPAVGQERVLPLGAMQLLVRLGGDHANEAMAIVTGIHTQAFVIDKVGRDRLFGIMFRPGGTFPFLPLPGSELVDQHAPLDAIWGRKIDELREKLEDAPTIEARFAVAERWLGAIMCRPLALHGAVGFALQQLGRGGAEVPRVGDLAEHVGLSKRRFIEVFSDQVGVTPKVFARLQRFQAALKSIPRGPVSWADLALASGYYDQAHFANEFRVLSGMTPSEYHAGRGEHLNHVPHP